LTDIAVWRNGEDGAEGEGGGGGGGDGPWRVGGGWPLWFSNLKEWSDEAEESMDGFLPAPSSLL